MIQFTILHTSCVKEYKQITKMSLQTTAFFKITNMPVYYLYMCVYHVYIEIKTTDSVFLPELLTEISDHSTPVV